MLSSLLNIFDDEGGYEAAYRARARQTKGCQGIAYGVKAYILDAMEILAGIWNKDRKYVNTDGIKRYWRKANILPADWTTNINNKVGSASLPAKDKQVSQEYCNNICSMLKTMCLKMNKSNDDTNTNAYTFQGSCLEDRDTDNLKESE